MDAEAMTAADHRRRAVLRAWLGGLAGVLVLIYGLAADLWWLTLAGFVGAGMSYTSYQRRHGRGTAGNDAFVGGDSGRHHDADDDGSDSGGGDSGGDGGGGD
jgi:hypothetical protein